MSSIPLILTGRLAKSVLLIALLLLLLPEAVRWGLIKGLEANGLGRASIEDVDVNLFTGRASVSGFSLQRDERHKLAFARLGLDLSWLKLVTGTVYIEQFDLAGTRLSVLQLADGHWEVVMPITSDQPEQAPPDAAEEAVVLPRLGAARVRLDDVEITVDTGVTKGLLAVEQLQLERVSNWLTDSTTLAMTAAWNGAPFEIEATASPWVEEPSLSARIRFDQVATEVAVSALAEPVKATLSMALTVTATRNRQGHISADIDGELAVEQLAAAYKMLHLTSERLAWQGQAQLTLAADQLQYRASGDVQASGVQLNDRQQQLQLLAWQALSVERLALDQQQTVSFDQLQLNGLELLREPGAERGRLSTGALTVRQFDLQQASTLQLEQVTISDGQYQLLLHKNGQLQLQTVLQTLQASMVEGDVPAAASTGADSGTAPFRVTLNELVVQEGSQLAFTDERFSVPVHQQLSINTFTVTNLDQQRPDTPTRIELVGSLGEFASVTVKGTAKPFADQLAVQLAGELDAIQLPDISPYSEAYMGYHLSRGQYDHRFELAIANADISLDNHLLLRKLQLAAVDPDKPQPMARELNVPLGLALDMLRDGDDNIRLDVPIKGRTDAPDIDISSVVNTALGKALTAGASSYLKLALQPYGAVLMAADFVGDRLSAVTLEPLLFDSGVADLNAEQQAYLVKIADLLKQRPKLELTLCARANEQDKASLQALAPEQPVEEAALVALAGQRSANVKRQLLADGLTSQRIFICQPAYQAQASSSVAMSM